MEIKTKTKLIRCLILIWFSLQALFMFFWPIHLYYCNGFKFFEVLVTGSILLPASLLIVVKNRIIRNIAYFLLWVYSVPFCFFAFLYIGLACTRDIFVLILATIYIVNIVLLFLKFYYSVTDLRVRWINVGHIYSKNIPIGFKDWLSLTHRGCVVIKVYGAASFFANWKT